MCIRGREVLRTCVQWSAGRMPVDGSGAAGDGDFLPVGLAAGEGDVLVAGSGVSGAMSYGILSPLYDSR